jgi:hypothetical protein
MVITILAEPRSGSTNLTNWFYFNKNFTTLFEPLNPISKWFQNGKELKDYKYKTNHICLKEIYYPHKDWKELIETSDKIILLYREDYQLQLESFLNAVTTNNWDSGWVFRVKNSPIIIEKTEYFNILKTEFKEKYLDKEFFKISYEELYYNNGFQKILDYLNMNELKNKNFPYGKKYRINVNKETNKLI